MPLYHQLGKIPHKRHTIFPKGKAGYHYEELFRTEGFSGMSSLLYHLNRPTQVKSIGKSKDVTPDIAVKHNIRSMLLLGFDVSATDDFLESRKTLLLNNDLWLGLAAPTKSMTDYFYKNADADELLFIHK